MHISRIVTAATLCSLSVLAFVNGFRGLSDGSGQRPDADDGNQDPKQPDSTTQAKGQDAIAGPEKLPNLPLSKVAVKQASEATSPPATNAGLPLSRNPRSPFYREAGPSLSTGQASSPAALATNPVSSSDEGNLDTAALAPFIARDIESHWAQNAIEYLASKQVIRGFPDGRFRPDQTITPAEFTTMVRKAFPSMATPPISYRDLEAARAGQNATRADAAAFIYRSLVRSEPSPIVTSIKVNGAVNRPGAYSMAAYSDSRLGAGKNFPTVARAIQQAGGSLNTANLKQVEVRRVGENGSIKVIKVDVQKVLESGDDSRDVILQQDDQLLIPPAPPTAQKAPQNSAILPPSQLLSSEERDF
jgi:hypothetical protein